jgi:hypothetical protein
MSKFKNPGCYVIANPVTRSELLRTVSFTKKLLFFLKMFVRFSSKTRMFFKVIYRSSCVILETGIVPTGWFSVYERYEAYPELVEGQCYI